VYSTLISLKDSREVLPQAPRAGKGAFIARQQLFVCEIYSLAEGLFEAIFHFGNQQDQAQRIERTGSAKERRVWVTTQLLISCALQVELVNGLRYDAL
jgi:hypothetical protein